MISWQSSHGGLSLLERENLLRREKELLKQLREAQEIPESGIGIVMLLNDTIKSYEQRLDVSQRFTESALAQLRDIHSISIRTNRIENRVTLLVLFVLFFMPGFALFSRIFH